MPIYQQCCKGVVSSACGPDTTNVVRFMVLFLVSIYQTSAVL